MRKILCLILAAVMAFTLAGCGGETGGTPTKVKNTQVDTTNAINAEITMEDGSVIAMELYPGVAPITVENFVALAKDGFYDGLTFHRVIEGFMIQGGDPDGNGTGGSDKEIKGEFEKNGVTNNLSHTRGVVSMARSNEPDSASSQFFIVHQDSPHLDGNYAAFGKVTSGMETVDRIATETPVEDANGTVIPPNQPKIKTITIK